MSVCDSRACYSSQEMEGDIIISYKKKQYGKLYCNMLLNAQIIRHFTSKLQNYTFGISTHA